MTASEIKYNPIYDHFFQNNDLEKDWKRFNSKGKDLATPLYRLPVDFSISEAGPSWREISKKIMFFVLKIVLFPWALYDLTRYIVRRLIMAPLYPAQSRCLRAVFQLFLPFSTKSLDTCRRETVKYLKGHGYLVRHVVLEKQCGHQSVRYSGLLVGHHTTIGNNKWVLQATGNLEPIEHSAPLLATTYKRFGYNTLLVNGPAVGRSEGEAIPESMGEAQELGLSFLESVVNANKIGIAGRSLGGAAVKRMIDRHQFKSGKDYLVGQQMTFDSSSNIIAKIVKEVIPFLGRFVKFIVIWSGCELDNIGPSRKLQQLGIREVIIQATSKKFKNGISPKIFDFFRDEIIKEKSCLGRRLVKKGLITNKTFIGLKFGNHMTNEAITAFGKELAKL